jgi:hypothetical protein
MPSIDTITNIPKQVNPVSFGNNIYNTNRNSNAKITVTVYNNAFKNLNMAI